MRLFKVRGTNNTIRKVFSDDKKICYGIIGTIGDLIDADILEYCDYTLDTWVFISSNVEVIPKFAKNKSHIIELINRQVC